LTESWRATSAALASRDADPRIRPRTQLAKALQSGQIFGPDRRVLGYVGRYEPNEQWDNGMNEPYEFLTRLKASYRNVDIDWEAVLEAVYLTLLSGRQGLGVIDIGGHAGRHAVVIQRELNPDHLLIFEPLPVQRGNLQARFAENSNVVVHGCALGARRGEGVFIVKMGAPEESGLRQRSFYNDHNNEDLERIPIVIETLDSMNIPFKVDFIKIDTEGGEVDILAGATELLSRDAPIISVEYGIGGYDAYGYEADTLYELAESLGYSIFDLFGHQFTAIQQWRSCVSQFYWDYFLIPDKTLTSVWDRIKIIQKFEVDRFLVK
jgi:FkbM family methyltransferase